MPDNPLQAGIDAGVSRLRKELATLDSVAGRVAPVNRRLMTRNEKLLSSLATPASQWSPEQALWVLGQFQRIKGKTSG